MIFCDWLIYFCILDVLNYLSKDVLESLEVAFCTSFQRGIGRTDSVRCGCGWGHIRL